MNTEPKVKPLPYVHRKWFFRLLVTIFVCLVPVFIFYAIGYRVSFFNEDGAIVTVGGMFISSLNDETNIFVNGEPVQDYRIFQRAAYIQNLPAGTHRVHVQGEGLHTWVKELPVYARIVTEATAFNFPVVPQLRLVTPYVSAANIPQVIKSTSTMPASGTVMYQNIWQASSTVATSSLLVNPEYLFLATAFGTSTASSATLLARIADELESFTFSSTIATSSTATSTATTTKELRDRVLYETADGLAVRWNGSESATPYYFCFQYGDATTTAKQYTKKSLHSLAAAYASLEESTEEGARVCRESIAIDTKGHEVYSFNFYPLNPDLVVLHTSGGLFITEIDDRAWQNAQLVYPGGDYELLIEGNQLFIRQEEHIFELLLEVEVQ